MSGRVRNRTIEESVLGSEADSTETSVSICAVEIESGIGEEEDAIVFSFSSGEIRVLKMEEEEVFLFRLSSCNNYS